MKKKKKKNRKVVEQPKVEKIISFADLLAEKKKLTGFLSDNEKKCYEYFVSDLHNTLEKNPNKKQVQVIENEVLNDSNSFIRSFESLKRICIYGTVKDKNIITPIESDVLQLLEGVWNKYGDEIMLNY